MIIGRGLEGRNYLRCLIPADGYYEWQVQINVKTKQPWFITLKNREPMALAGLWERWQSPEDEAVDSCSIIVTNANELTRPIHDRMPVILAANDWQAWLNPELKDVTVLKGLLRPYSPNEMTTWKVGTQVNSPRNNSEDCIKPIEASFT